MFAVEISFKLVSDYTCANLIGTLYKICYDLKIMALIVVYQFHPFTSLFPIVQKLISCSQ